MSRVLAAVVLMAGVAGTLAPAHSHAAMTGHLAAHAEVVAPCHAAPVDIAATVPVDCQSLCDRAALADSGPAKAPVKAPAGPGTLAVDAAAIQLAIPANSRARLHPPGRLSGLPRPDVLLVTRRLLI